MIEEYVNKKLIARNAANQHLLETLGVTMENLEEHEIAVNEEGEIVRVQRVMKATIWEKKKANDNRNQTNKIRPRNI